MMKEIIISAKRVKKELTWLLICFGIAFLMNITAIILYHTPWVEAFTQMGYVVTITLCLYLLLWVIRLIGALFGSFLKRKTK
ncbi:MAG: hypothetical protein PHH64_02325 [Proteiniphilum sp.]|nr:hypothetical protein [Proteiniphilum sp.]